MPLPKTKRLKPRKRRYKFESNDDIFNGSTIRHIIKFIREIHSEGKEIHFILNCKRIADKLAYITFECLCYYLIVECKHEIQITWSPSCEIWSDGITLSALRYLTKSAAENNYELFLKRFLFDIYDKHFRRIIKADSETSRASVIYQDLNSFLKGLNLEKDFIEDASEVVVELLNNSIEHAQSDCLIDVDVSQPYQLSVGDVVCGGKEYFSINIVVLNFSDKLLGDDLKERINTEEHHIERYLEVTTVWNKHIKFFNNKYKENHFWMLASMQNKVSGQISKGQSGGTGSAVLIKSLQKQSFEDKCYVLSGKYILFYIKELLGEEEDYWWGFNDENDFVDNSPSERVLNQCNIYFPGTAYNLCFIAERKIYDEKNQTKI